jgi:hypothetical protein
VVIPTLPPKCKDRTAISESRGIALSILNLDNSSIPPNRFIPGEQASSSRWIGRREDSQCRSGSGGEEENLLPLLGTEPQFLARLALTSTAISTELLINYLFSSINEYQYYRKIQILKIRIRNLRSIEVHFSTRFQ